uniref:Uncharacterized protein n=1 Tax=Caenorhabditis tropicalis TaxID=1561998 RepID=A0A1I7UPT1_9PELO
MSLTVYPPDQPPKPIYTFRLNIKKEEWIGSYVHPVMRRMRYFYLRHGIEFNAAIQTFYQWRSPDFNLICYACGQFIHLRLHELRFIRSKARAVRMYKYALQNFHLLFCRDLFAIMRYKEDFYKFERLETFLTYVYDPSLQTLKDTMLKAYFP